MSTTYARRVGSENSSFDLHHDLLPSPMGEGREDLSKVDADQVQVADLVIIDRRALSRECLARSLEAATGRKGVVTFESVEEWLSHQNEHPEAAIILLCIGGRKTDDERVIRDLDLLANAPKSLPVVLLSDVEEIGQILGALDSGAQGYIPTSVSLNVAIEAMHLVKAGGIYVPASSFLLWKRSGGQAESPAKDALSEVFTTRQSAVLKALREGKANKIIAYELNMRESTVKVHVRNIMRKLKARNRTEVAYKTNNMLMEQRAL